MILFLLVILFFPVMSFAQSVVTPGQTVAKSALPTMCVNPSSFALESCSDGTEGTRFSCFVETVTVTTECQAAPSSGLRNYVVSVVYTNFSASALTFTIVYGTGANCVTGLTTLASSIRLPAVPSNLTHTFSSPLVPPTVQAICIKPSAAASFSATLTGFIAP